MSLKTRASVGAHQGGREVGGRCVLVVAHGGQTACGLGWGGWVGGGAAKGRDLRGAVSVARPTVPRRVQGPTPRPRKTTTYIDRGGQAGAKRGTSGNHAPHTSFQTQLAARGGDADTLEGVDEVVLVYHVFIAVFSGFLLALAPSLLETMHGRGGGGDREGKAKGRWTASVVDAAGGV